MSFASGFRIRELGIAVLLLLAAACTRTVDVAVTNPSFELGTFVNDGKGTMILQPDATEITGWTVVDDELAWIGNPNPWALAAQDGDRFLDLTAYPRGAPFGGVTQTIATVPERQYRLSYHLGSHTARWGGPPVSVTASAGNDTQTCSVTTPSSGSTWTACTLDFTATAASTGIRFSGKEGSQYIGLDNVSVQTTEIAWWPLLLLLVVLAILIVEGTRRRRQRESTRSSASE